MGGRILKNSRLAGTVAALPAGTGFLAQAGLGKTRISVQATGGTFAGARAEGGG
ncbi:MAG: hypothetical protein IOD01_01420 [Rhodobacter sp.]|nr:hypothetical protein [Rhodobacter sp.]